MTPPIFFPAERTPPRLEGQQGILDGPVEAPARNHGAQVSARADQSGHNGELLPRGSRLRPMLCIQSVRRGGWLNF